MPETWLHALAGLSALCGMGWLALAMEVHWRQVRAVADGPGVHAAVALRMLALGAIAASLGLCLAADHASIAVLVWIMLLVASTWLVATALAWRPRWLSLLASVVPTR
jgi:hypothetical protein